MQFLLVAEHHAHKANRKVIHLLTRVVWCDMQTGVEGVTEFGKTPYGIFFLKIEFHAWLISSTKELTRI